MPGPPMLHYNPADNNSYDWLSRVPHDVWHYLFALCFDQDQGNGILSLMFTCRYMHEIGVNYLYSQANIFFSGLDGNLVQYTRGNYLAASEFVLRHCKAIRDVMLLCDDEPFLPRFSFVSTIPHLRSLNLVTLDITQDVHTFLLGIPNLSSLGFLRCWIEAGNNLFELPPQQHVGLQCLEVSTLNVAIRDPFGEDIACQEFMAFWTAWVGPSLNMLDFEGPLFRVFGHDEINHYDRASRNLRFLEPLFASIPATITHLKLSLTAMDSEALAGLLAKLTNLRAFICTQHSPDLPAALSRPVWSGLSNLTWVSVTPEYLQIIWPLAYATL
ncbi:hypothetical protein DACRYDRAFT_115090 [Dacryopinax primogenitus]|uniref:F-box domain-containing protein n=1 Tax=Dacryopinax primogenitus (strain DJM 731) TaxID=1858805 RepID=M5G6D0_DACPD|nr:uncharacterized protein DACRYDRAFT_115090 [Dacryopinax primogenitus]EJU03760.1 hypothetical protein DACRYDRAFT_115090 [Dacryopinax primogenitus]